MKTFNLSIVIVLIIVLLASLTAFSANPEPDKNKKSLKKTISRILSYPEFAKEKSMEGFVIFSFSLDESGKVCVKEINSDSEYLKNYVVQKLNENSFSVNEETRGKTFYYRVDFMLLK